MFINRRRAKLNSEIIFTQTLKTKNTAEKQVT